MTQPAQRPDLPPGLALYYIGVGHYVSRAMYVAVKLGIADHLRDGPRSAEALAAATGTHAPSLRRVLRLLASVGIFAEREDGELAQTPMSELLRRDVPGSMHASVTLFTGPRIQDHWKELEFCVRTGLPAIQKDQPGANPFDELAKDPVAAANFDRA